MIPQLKDKLELDEYTFFHTYFELQNIKRSKDIKLTERENQLASIICSKPNDYFISNSKSLNGKSKKYEIAEEMSISKHQIYALIKNLKKKGVLKVDEDNFWELSDQIKKLRSVIKEQIKNKDFSLDYVFGFTIRKNDNNSGGHNREQVKALETAES
jgi:biotin operon repressor